MYIISIFIYLFKCIELIIRLSAQKINFKVEISLNNKYLHYAIKILPHYNKLKSTPKLRKYPQFTQPDCKTALHGNTIIYTQ